MGCRLMDMCNTRLFAKNMSKMIQVRDVPDQVHSILKARAAREGMSLSDFIKRELERSVERPTMREWLERTRHRLAGAQHRCCGNCAMHDDCSGCLGRCRTADKQPACRYTQARSGRPYDSFLVPYVLDIEVARAFRNLVASKRIDSHRSAQFLSQLSELPAERYPDAPSLPRIWELRHNFTAYDAAYIALAEMTGAVLYTCDEKLVKGHRARVVLFTT